jgi:hypothetical protein
MFSYYGSKTTLVDYYPKPKHSTLIEPFAGAAKYSLKYFDKDVILYDKYEVIIKVWKYLQECSPKDILSLPDIDRSQKLSDFDLSEGERLLMGFLITAGGQSPRNTPSPNCTTNRPHRIRTRIKDIAKNLYKIKHWKIVHGSYLDIPNIKATWFIDPPYQFGGDVYIESNKNIDFGQLGNWAIGQWSGAAKLLSAKILKLIGWNLNRLLNSKDPLKSLPSKRFGPMKKPIMITNK